MDTRVGKERAAAESVHSLYEQEATKGSAGVIGFLQGYNYVFRIKPETKPETGKAEIDDLVILDVEKCVGDIIASLILELRLVTDKGKTMGEGKSARWHREADMYTKQSHTFAGILIGELEKAGYIEEGSVKLGIGEDTEENLTKMTGQLTKALNDVALAYKNLSKEVKAEVNRKDPIWGL